MTAHKHHHTLLITTYTVHNIKYLLQINYFNSHQLTTTTNSCNTAIKHHLNYPTLPTNTAA